MGKGCYLGELEFVEKIRLDRIEHCKVRYILERPLDIDLFKDDEGYYILRSGKLEFAIFDRNKEDALKSLCEEFHLFYCEYVVSDEKLSEEAESLKKYLTRLVKKTEVVQDEA